ncbi:hypothetical protein COU15_03175 [Candidatus Kaiserbacteria bacterium CG10_big_fil_rev_8_21_14_0_10_45_20]|uniref:DUF1653 domain-containing protein n=1 Tax=Candidatus Kaiserbacteria bacterium CG10_big_fil_rev_8_21_14_0_10_45_20 TaxID=1974607 RepID=A0A2H0UEZ1_9BACT|nr:MAG: hypothetical protein COU15_03175 [Candidatus Kaiserbacteria bacterium CG10_big_fil_rev_8_21_14_0_10_45_20]
MNQPSPKVHPQKLYRHYKGALYFVEGVAIEATDAREGTEVIVYRSIALGLLFTRDIEEFVAPIEWPDGVVRPRFIQVSDSEVTA